MSSAPWPIQTPLSPASPPEVGYQPQIKELPPNKAPTSPVSPPYMSVATKSYVSSYENNRHSDDMAQRPPRSPVNGYLDTTQRTSINQSDTPNHLKRSLPEEDVTRPGNKRQKTETTHNFKDVDTQIAPTNHDRQDVVKQEDRRISSNGPGIEGSQEPNKDNSNRMLSSERSVKDIAPALLLCQSTHPRSSPDPNQHLMGTYGLSSLLQSMARNDPITGEKINKLRKSYEGQIKPFALPGRIKPYAEPREKDQPGKLRSLATLLDVEWQKGAGEVKIEVTQDLQSKLSQALQLNPGTMPKSTNIEWEDVLGHEKPKPVMPQVQPGIAPQMRLPNGVRMPPTSGSGLDKMRTRGKKRSYDDSSFIGWGEGYSDVDSDADYGDRKKRKKE